MLTAELTQATTALGEVPEGTVLAKTGKAMARASNALDMAKLLLIIIMKIVKIVFIISTLIRL